MYITSITQCL